MSFGTAVFLWAALAGIIPVVLHLINRQNAPVVHFSTIRFLRLSVQRTRRRKRIHDLLLLLLRVAALVLIAVALAQPAIRWLHRWLSGQASTAVALIVDNSGSMATTDQNGPRWDRAVSATLQILDSLQEGDQVALLMTNGPPPLATRGLLRKHEVVRRAFLACRPGFERADLVATLAEARRLLRSAPSPNQEIYILTDMQACCWNDLRRLEDGEDNEVTDIPIVIVDVGGPRLPNSALTQIAAEATAPVAGVPLRIAVGIQGDAQVAEERHVSLYVDGQKRDTSPTLRIEPAQLVHHTFHVELGGKRIHHGRLQLEGEDACPADDRLYFAANTDPAVPVAVLKTAEHEIRNLDQAYYLERALAPQGDQTGAILVDVLEPAALATETLSRFTIIFCVNLPTPDLVVAQQLVNYVESGGNLIWISGDNVDPVAYSALNDRLQGRLLPTRLLGVQQVNDRRPAGWNISWFDPQHQAVAPFAEPASIYQSVQVLRFIEMASADPSSVQVLARLNGGHPLLVQRRVEAGSIFLLATSLHVDWTNFPLKPLFLPFLSHLTFQLAGSNANQPSLSAGTPWRLSIPVGEDVTMEVAKPNGNVVRVARPDSDTEPFRFEDTHEVGVYEVRIHRGRTVQQTAFTVNPDPEESAPDYLTGTQLEPYLAPSRVFFCGDAAQVSQTIRDLRKGLELQGLFLMIVIVVLIAEAYQANRREYRVSTEEQRGR